MWITDKDGIRVTLKRMNSIEMIIINVIFFLFPALKITFLKKVISKISLYMYIVYIICASTP